MLFLLKDISPDLVYCLFAQVCCSDFLGDRVKTTLSQKVGIKIAQTGLCVYGHTRTCGLRQPSHGQEKLGTKLVYNKDWSDILSTIHTLMSDTVKVLLQTFDCTDLRA